MEEVIWVKEKNLYQFYIYRLVRDKRKLKKPPFEIGGKNIYDATHKLFVLDMGEKLVLEETSSPDDYIDFTIIDRFGRKYCFRRIGTKEVCEAYNPGLDEWIEWKRNFERGEAHEKVS